MPIEYQKWRLNELKCWLLTRKRLVAVRSRERSWIFDKWVYRRIHLAGWRHRSLWQQAERIHDTDLQFCDGIVQWTDLSSWIHDPIGHSSSLPMQLNIYLIIWNGWMLFIFITNTCWFLMNAAFLFNFLLITSENCLMINVMIHKTIKTYSIGLIVHRYLVVWWEDSTCCPTNTNEKWTKTFKILTHAN